MSELKVKILGTGCRRCKALKESTKKAIELLNINAEIEEVKDINQILEYPVMMTPALVVNEQVVVSGKVPSHEEIAEMIKKVIQSEQES